MIPYFQFTTIQLGPIPLQVWGFFVALGMGVSLYLLHRIAKKKGIPSELLLDYAVWMIVGGLIVSRLFHVIFYEPGYFLSHPIDIIKIWHGGLSSFGGLVGAVVGFFLYRKTRDKKQLPLRAMTDMFSFAALFGWMIGRIGCFMIHDHLGAHANCPLAINTPDGPRLEMALLEIIGLIPLLVVFLVMRKRKVFDGWYTIVLFVYYGLLRFVLDFFRATDIVNPDVRYFGLTPGQYFAILLVGVGVYLYHSRRISAKR